jgi:hypothetical protein
MIIIWSLVALIVALAGTTAWLGVALDDAHRETRVLHGELRTVRHDLNRGQRTIQCHRQQVMDLHDQLTVALAEAAHAHLAADQVHDVDRAIAELVTQMREAS